VLNTTVAAALNWSSSHFDALQLCCMRLWYGCPLSVVCLFVTDVMWLNGRDRA